MKRHILLSLDNILFYRIRLSEEDKKKDISFEPKPDFVFGDYLIYVRPRAREFVQWCMRHFNGYVYFLTCMERNEERKLLETIDRVTELSSSIELFGRESCIINPRNGRVYKRIQKVREINSTIFDIDDEILLVSYEGCKDIHKNDLLTKRSLISIPSYTPRIEIISLYNDTIHKRVLNAENGIVQNVMDLAVPKLINVQNYFPIDIHGDPISVSSTKTQIILRHRSITIPNIHFDESIKIILHALREGIIWKCKTYLPDLFMFLSMENGYMDDIVNIYYGRKNDIHSSIVKLEGTVEELYYIFLISMN